MQGVRGRGYDGYSNHHFPSLFLALVREASLWMGTGAHSWGSSPPQSQEGWMVSELLFSSTGQTTEMLEKASYTTRDKNRALWGMVLWTQASRRNKDTSVPSLSFYLTAPRAAQGNEWLLMTNSLVYWASKQLRPLGMVPRMQHSWLLFS